jgi:hypothetical protein
MRGGSGGLAKIFRESLESLLTSPDAEVRLRHEYKIPRIMFLGNNRVRRGNTVPEIFRRAAFIHSVSLLHAYSWHVVALQPSSSYIPTQLYSTSAYGRATSD